MKQHLADKRESHLWGGIHPDPLRWRGGCVPGGAFARPKFLNSGGSGVAPSSGVPREGGKCGGAAPKLTAPFRTVLRSVYAKISCGTVTHQASSAVRPSHPPSPPKTRRNMVQGGIYSMPRLTHFWGDAESGRPLLGFENKL